MNSLSWFIARRYLTARRRQAFISLISGVSILGVGVGVMALVVALALMTGVQSELRDRIVGSAAHVYVYRLPDANGNDLFGPMDEERPKLSMPGVTGIAPAIIGQGLGVAFGRNAPITLKGIDPAAEPSVTDIVSAMRTGSLNALVNRSPDDKPGIILGADVAEALDVRVGDPVAIVTPDVSTTFGGPQPHYRSFTVVGIFKFGLYQVDTTYALVLLKDAAEMLGKVAPDGHVGAEMMQLRLSNMDDAERVRDQLRRKLGADYVVRDWEEENGSLYSALRLEKLAISLTIGLIVMVAALNIVASLVLLVMEKTRDIAILRTMGAPARVIRRIFILQGLIIGLIGTGAGTMLGVVGSFVADRYHLIKLPSDVYQISYLPFRILPLDVLFVVAAAVLVCLVATLYPSRQAGRIDPAEALRNQ